MVTRPALSSKIDYAAVEAAVQHHGLCIYGGFHGGPEDGLPDNHETLMMLGPGPDFWPHFKTTPEFLDGEKDPVDRWSARVIGALATELGATPFLPFGGPPYAPFLSWALKTGRAWSSPVGMLVHDQMGLMVSYRGALVFAHQITLPPLSTKPCDTCAKPCLTACPVNALSADNGYDTGACHAHLDTPQGAECLSQGCIA